MNCTKKLLTIGVTGFLFLGCMGDNPTPTSDANKKLSEPKKELTEQEKKYQKVIDKTINDCKENGIELNQERTEQFVKRFSQADVDKIVTITAKIPKRNCQLFSDETSLEKVEKVKVAVKKTVEECNILGVKLNKEAVEKHISKIPLFVIKKVLEANKDSTKEDCVKMKSVL